MIHFLYFPLHFNRPIKFSKNVKWLFSQSLHWDVNVTNPLPIACLYVNIVKLFMQASFISYMCPQGEILGHTVNIYKEITATACSIYRVKIYSTQRQIILRSVGYHFPFRLTVTLNLCQIYLKLLVHVLKQVGQCSCDFEVNQTKIKGGCQSGKI